MSVWPDGTRVVERIGSEAHTHDLEYIDGVKRNSGVRALALDGFFKSWEAGGILAFLRDASKAGAKEGEIGGAARDILRDAGGLYLTRQEVQNILNGALKKAYPGQDIGEVKRQMDKYRSYTTCNFKGCDAPPFPDIKALMEHRKAVHGLKTHDHSDKLYACPDKTCWRRKKSKGFATLLGLEEHMRQKHGGASSGIDPSTILEAQAQPSEKVGNELQGLDPLMQSPLTPGLDNMNINLIDSMRSPPDPNFITPDPVDGAPTQSAAVHEEPVSEGETLGPQEVEAAKLRIKRLKIERNKLDAEIRKLNRIVYGDERGKDGNG